MIKIPAYSIEIPTAIKKKYGFADDLKFSISDFFEEMQECSIDNANAIAKIEESFTIGSESLEHNGPEHPVFNRSQTWFLLNGGMFDKSEDYIACRTQDEINDALEQNAGNLDKTCLCLLDSDFPKDEAMRIFKESRMLTDDLYDQFCNSDDLNDNYECDFRIKM